PVAAAWERTPARAPRALDLARPGAAARVRESWRRIGQSLRLLAVVDRAGAAPGDARARAEGLAAMTGALDTGLTLVSPDTAFGMWEVTGRRHRAPHRPLVPVRRLGERIPSGVTQLYRLDRALDRMRNRTRPTPTRRGLNAAVLAAYRQMEREYGDGLNVVLVFTTRGRREPLEPDHAATVRTLGRSFRYDRPVSVVVVGFGDGVPPGLRQLARATDGGAYHISSPDRLLDLFKSSDGLRVCDDPRCAD
ncbi:hypothetical protein ACSNOI_37325, partial [Actinomadura kijaniata]|uniref:hypothetical protein n=1 Tax=Actinomadura kijaniata TaxID=46161 RepID=UPI003F195533